MSIELLKTRIEVLLRSVGEVDAVVRVLEANRQELKRMSSSLKATRIRAAKLNADHKGIIRELEGLRNPLDALDDAAAVEAINQTIEIFSTIETLVPKLVEELDGPVANLEEIACRAVMFDEKFVAGVDTATKRVKEKIDGFLVELNNDSKAMPDPWDKYFKDIVPAANDLFSDYMDLLGGVSIRERGVAISALSKDSEDQRLDHSEEVDPQEGLVCRVDQLCAMADWHVVQDLRPCLDLVSADALTIPGRDSTGQLMSWPILRLGFASWSIWGMPLEGHEYGKLVASERAEQLRTWKDELAAFGEQGLHVLVADTIGAWTEGPAYACALLFLSLDPRHSPAPPGGAYVSNAERAILVRTCLRNQITAARPGSTPEQVNAGYGYLEFVDRIVDQWKTALPPTTDTVTKSEKARLLELLPQRVWNTFKLKRAFGVGDWLTVTTVWKRLAQGQGMPDDPPAGMHHLMNAAWYARLHDAALAGQLRPAEIERRALDAGHAKVQQRAGRRTKTGGPK